MPSRREPRHPPRQFPPPRSVADLPDFSQPASGLPSVALRRQAPPAPRPTVEPRLPPYRPVSRRLRVWIVVLTLVTALGIAALMLRPQLRLLAAKADRLDRAAAAQKADAARQPACPPDAVQPAPGCPGSRMPVSMLPAVTPGDAASR